MIFPKRVKNKQFHFISLEIKIKQLLNNFWDLLKTMVRVKSKNTIAYKKWVKMRLNLLFRSILFFKCGRTFIN